MSKKTLLAACALAAVTCYASHSWAETKIAVGTPPIAEVEAAFIAKDQGMFERNGLDVQFLPTGSNQTLIASLVAGTHQIVSVSPTVLLQAVDSGIDLVAVSNCGVSSLRTAKNVGLAVHDGVSIPTPEDIKGKKIGTPSVGGTLDILFRQWLKQKNIAEKSVTFIEVPIPNTADVLKGGTIDGIIAGEPFLGRSVALSKGSVAFYYMKDLPEGIPYSTFVTTREWAAKNPDALKAFRTAMDQAAAFSKQDTDKTREIVSKYTHLPMEVLSKIELPDCKTPVNKDALEYLDKAMREEGLLKNPIDIAGLIAQ
ncbi:NitT/TauT family transport system substrate-binding protein [Ensifer adhaerens]|nr:NitT/TauT family transport system substrate-binding protein [Ensifer adhaerens]